jgi:hypothetical protein
VKNISVLQWINTSSGLAGWVSGLGAFAAAGAAVWIARWQNKQRLLEIDRDRQIQAAARAAELRLKQWLLAVALRPALLYVKARVSGTRNGALKLCELQKKPSWRNQTDERAWTALKIELPQDLLTRIVDFAVFGAEVGGGLGELVAYARLLNELIDAGKVFDQRPAPVELVRRADELFKVLSVIEAGIERIVQAGPPSPPT